MATTRTEQDWIDLVRTNAIRSETSAALTVLTQALAEWPLSTALRRVQAGLYQQAGRQADAESILDRLLREDAHDVATTFALGHLLRSQGRMAAAATVVRTCFASTKNLEDVNLAIAAIELLDDCDRKCDAAAIAEAAIAVNHDDPRLHAYAGMLEMQLGDFERARQHYTYALEHDERAWEWHISIGLSSAQRYESSEHADFKLFHAGLQKIGLTELARAELHFALGKAHDDVGQWAAAARHFGEGNAIRHRQTSWSRETWRIEVEACLAATPFVNPVTPTDGFTPIFIVGMPRSGTTLLAELLSRAPMICNRGELPWLARLRQQSGLTGTAPKSVLAAAANHYARQSRQDDPGCARWFIDKQPLNFRYVDLALALFPDARIIHCQRNPGDIALSLWMQCFLDDVQGYAYDFEDIDLVMRDCDRLMAHWRERFPNSIKGVKYEQLVTTSDSVIAELLSWIGLSTSGDAVITPPESRSAISTASLWQVRQPVHARSINRTQAYLPYIPALARWASG